MKYHFQFVSRTAVRVELIPEDQKEIELIDQISHCKEDDVRVTELFRKGVETYSSNTILTQTRFMNFPSVALCNYITEAKPIETLSLDHVYDHSPNLST